MKRKNTRRTLAAGIVIAQEELCLAYRKAKVDLYYSSLPPLRRMADYELNLAERLQSLSDHLLSGRTAWVKSDAFLKGGGDFSARSWTLVPKGFESLKDSNGNAIKDDTLVCSSPWESWQTFHADPARKSAAEFRLMADVSLDFHVLGSLWMLKVGHHLEKRLSDHAYGSRLRRNGSGQINVLALGSFKPYLKPFKDWRDGGIKAMREALEAKKSVVALTADVGSFYHELSPDFLLDPSFLKVLGVDLDDTEQALNALFVKALKAWAASTPLGRGLPVGLPSSALVANLALVELDRLFVEQVAPIYYGRYVDDILLVMENGAAFKSAAELWAWLFKRSNGLLDWEDSAAKSSVRFQPKYLANSKICFSNNKNKVFLLSGESGMTLVASIDQQIRQRASEWRALPDLPYSPMEVATALASATQSDGDVADNLRKTSAMSMKRSGFAMKLRDFEAYERDLEPQAWQPHRHAFLKAFIEHVLEPRTFFDLATYLPRVIRLATACEDFELLSKLIARLMAVEKLIREHCTVEIKPSCKPGDDSEGAAWIAIWYDKLMDSVREAILAALPPTLSQKAKRDWKMVARLAELAWPLGLRMDKVRVLHAEHARLFACDLAHMPFRFRHLPAEMVSQRGIPLTANPPTIDALREWLPSSVADGLETLCSWCHIKRGVPMGFAFSTRPFGLAELFVRGGMDVLAEDRLDELNGVVLALRGFTPEGQMPRMDARRVLHVADSKATLAPTIAVSSWKTDLGSWAAAVCREDDPDTTRYARLNRLVNEVISRPHEARYFILPELAMPVRWFMRVANKLRGKGISLIAGVEYLHGKRGRVRNQVWASLTHDGLGFPSLMVYRQDKQRPALHEEQELQRLKGLKLSPTKAWAPDEPPIIDHGGLRFSLLVCSELTNIRYRAALRGRVDALFVPEWNQDTESFNALVESAALDVHAYIIQCNDRSFGDSRIRAPYKDNWERDVLRVKGGKDDYWVTGEINAVALRMFQSSYRSPGKPFKPVPDGFEISRERKVLPQTSE